MSSTSRLRTAETLPNWRRRTCELAAGDDTLHDKIHELHQIARTAVSTVTDPESYMADCLTAIANLAPELRQQSVTLRVEGLRKAFFGPDYPEALDAPPLPGAASLAPTDTASPQANLPSAGNAELHTASQKTIATDYSPSSRSWDERFERLFSLVASRSFDLFISIGLGLIFTGLGIFIVRAAINHTFQPPVLSSGEPVVMDPMRQNPPDAWLKLSDEMPTAVAFKDGAKATVYPLTDLALIHSIGGLPEHYLVTLNRPRGAENLAWLCQKATLGESTLHPSKPTDASPVTPSLAPVIALPDIRLDCRSKQLAQIDRIRVAEGDVPIPVDKNGYFGQIQSIGEGKIVGRWYDAAALTRDNTLAAGNAKFCPAGYTFDADGAHCSQLIALGEYTTSKPSTSAARDDLKLPRTTEFVPNATLIAVLVPDAKRALVSMPVAHAANIGGPPTYSVGPSGEPAPSKAFTLDRAPPGNAADRDFSDRPPKN